MQTGTIRHLTDAGTIVQVGISAAGQTRWLAADGNLFRRAAAHYLATHPEVPTLIGLAITYEQTDWGGLTSFTVTTQEPPR
jgi:hypothetical protein